VHVITATGGTEPYLFSVDSGALPAGLSLSSSGTLSGVPSVPGFYSFVVKVTDNTSPTSLESVKAFSLTIEAPGSITIQQEVLPDAVQNHLYETTLSAVGGATSYTWSVSSGSLPPGISLAADGMISGTPTNYGDWGFIVEVTDGTLTNTKPLDIKVIPELVIATQTIPDALLNDAYSYTMTATGGTAPYTWQKDFDSAPLPSGLQLSQGGHITGKPTAAGSYSFALRVTDSSSPTIYVTKAFVMEIKEVIITTTTVPDAFWDLGYAALIEIESVIATTPSWSWSLQPGAGGLPPNLGLYLDDPLTGTGIIRDNVIPGTGVVDYTFTVVVIDDNSGKSDDQELTITVRDGPPVAEFNAIPTTGPASLTVDFFDISAGTVTSWAWDFDNNGTTDSDVRNPSYIYNSPGTYTVKLTVTGPGGTDEEVKIDYISVTPPP
jgi:hypothetical protein